MSFDVLSPVGARLLWAVFFLLAGGVAYRLLNAWLLKRARRMAQFSLTRRRGRAVLLYFSTPDCQPCKTSQKPAIQKLHEIIGEGIEIIEVNAAEEVQLANQWGVLSVPTTFIIDAQGTPRFINHGVASTEKLLRQILKISGVGNHAKHSHSNSLAQLHQRASGGANAGEHST